MQTSGGIFTEETAAQCVISDAEQHRSDPPIGGGNKRDTGRDDAVSRGEHRREPTVKLARRAEALPERARAKRARTNGWGDNRYDVVDTDGERAFCLFWAANCDSKIRVLSFRRLDDSEYEDLLMPEHGLTLGDVSLEQDEHEHNAIAFDNARKHDLCHLPFHMVDPDAEGLFGGAIEWKRLCIWKGDDEDHEVDTGVDVHGFTYIRYWWSHADEEERYATTHMLVGNLLQTAAQVEYVWGLDHKVRNKLVHALSGNTTEEERQRKFDRAYNEVHETRTCTGGRTNCGRVFSVYLREHLRQRSGKYGNLNLHMCNSCRLYEKACSEVTEDWVDDVPAIEVDKSASDVALSDIEGMGITVGRPAPAMAEVPVVVAVAQHTKAVHNRAPQPRQERAPAQEPKPVEGAEAAEKKPAPDGPKERATSFEMHWRKCVPAILADSAATCFSTHGAMGFGEQGQGGVPIVLLAGDVRALVQNNPHIYVVTKKFANFSGSVFGIPYEMTRDFQFVRIENLVWRHCNWLYGLDKHAGGIASAKLFSIDADGVQMDVWKLWADDEVEAVAQNCYGHHSADSTHYAWFIGSDTATVFRDRVRHDIRKATWSQASRFFSGTTTASVAASQIAGSLKQNEELSGGDIDAMLNVLSIQHEGNALHNARARAGDKGLWKEVADTVNDQLTRKPWWMPKLAWSFVSPYRRTWSDGADALLTLCLLFGALSILSAIAGCGGLINALLMFDRTFIGAGVHFDYIMVQQIAHTVHAGVKNVTDEYLRNKVPTKGAWHYILRGGGQDYARWYYLKDEGAGDRIARGMDNAPTFEAQAASWIIAQYSWSGLLLFIKVFLWPVLEEFMKRSRILVPIVYPYFEPNDMDVAWSNLAVAMGNGHDEAVRVAAARDWAHRHYWFSRYWRGGQRYGVYWFELGTVFTTGVIVVESLLSTDVCHVFATLLIHLYCYVCTFQHAVVVHIIYNICAAMVGFPMASLVRAGKYMVSSVVAVGLSEFFRNKPSGRFPRVEPMGTDSQFTEYAEDPACDDKFPLKPGTKDDLKVKFKATRGKNRLTTLLSVFVLAASFASNTSNVLHSVYGRVLKDVPGCTNNTEPIVKALDQMTKKMGYVEPDKAEDWAQKFPTRKRNRYLAALTYMSVVGYACFNDTLLGAPNQWYKRSCFLKHEVNLCQLDKVVFGSNGRAYVISCSDPRTIQASEDVVQCAAGPYFTAYGRRASEVFDGGDGSIINGWRVCMAFGRTKSETAKILRSMQDNAQQGIVDCGDDVFLVWNRCCYAIDASRWDAHVSATLLKLKARHLRGLGMAPEVVNMLDRLIKRRGSYKGLGVRFALEGDVASGDPDTLYWNTVLGVSVVLSALDGAKDFDDFAKRCTEWGIEYELAAVGSRTEPHAKLDFCSCVFVPTADGWTLAPKLGRSIMKLAYTANSGNPAALLASKIMGLSYDLAAYPDVVQILRQHLADLPVSVAAQESYIPVGKVDPADFEEIDAITRVRYGHSYQEILDELQTLISRSRLGQMRSGDLCALQDCVASDYGKTPLPGPLPEAAAVRHRYVRKQARRNSHAKMVIAFSLVGWLGQIIFGRETRLLRAYGKGQQHPGEGDVEWAGRPGQWWRPQEEAARWKREEKEGRCPIDEGSGGLHGEWHRGKGAFISQEQGAAGHFRESWTHNWRCNGTRFVKHNGRWRLCIQRHRAHPGSADTRGECKASHFKHGVRDGSHFGGWCDIQSEVVRTQPIRTGRVPMGQQDFNAVHEVSVCPAPVRVSLEHFGLRCVGSVGHGDLRTDLQRGANVFDEATDGGGNPRSLHKAVEQHHVWDRVRARGRGDELEVGSDRWARGNQSDRPWSLHIRDIRVATDGGHEVVARGDLGALHGRTPRPSVDCTESGIRRRCCWHGDMERRRWEVRKRARWHRTIDAVGEQRARRVCEDGGHHNVSGTATGGLLCVGGHWGPDELVVLQAGTVRGDCHHCVHIGNTAERPGSNVHCEFHGWEWNRNGAGQGGCAADSDVDKQCVAVLADCGCTGFARDVGGCADVHEPGVRRSEWEHIGSQLRVGGDPGDLITGD